jgi:hypothetical protein
MVDIMLYKVTSRNKGKSDLEPLMKEGISLPVPIKDPVKFLMENSEASCSPPT